MAMKYPVTSAIRMLRQEKADFTEYQYKYEDKGGTMVSARELGVDEHLMIKTIVLEDEKKRPFIVLMHGDLQISTKKLSRIIGVKTLSSCDPETATKHTGYLVGGTSPFGTRKTLPIYMEETIADLPNLYINAGKRGYLVRLKSEDLIRILKPKPVKVGI